ncbi:hypothetical protein [Corynebacterium callunae]|uniref:Uncharacterized protein n=1 Tax=Corynebacterium callunae DSM 20147 TaxID=1121353 RepID=M1TQ90_9CORY|nr:hypothetical protein [Corynebacterium callunae]AGG66521.1 hypothetical protein H924_05375 [Corynebacterium callunae DSM 20147]
MIIIASVVLLLVGAMLAILAAALLSAGDPYGRISYYFGIPDEYNFTAYTFRFVAFFPLMLSAAMATTFFGVWAMLIIPLGYYPSLMMVRQHNKQVAAMWEFISVNAFVETHSPLV